MHTNQCFIGKERVAMKRTLAMLLAAALALGLAGCGPKETAPGSQSTSTHEADFTVVQEPTYPEFPQFPQQPSEDSSEADWQAYYDAFDSYYSAVTAFRGGGVMEQTRLAMSQFAAASAPLALKGQEGQNVVYSPVSLWSALAMAARCAQGDSQSQALQVLGVSQVQDLDTQAQALWRGLYTDDGVSALVLANSIWLNDAQKASYEQTTLDALTQHYYAGVYSTPMGTPGADQAVAEWIGQQTRGLIDQKAAPVGTEEETLALLISSLYYKAAWMTPFSPENTQDGEFTAAGGQALPAQFMHDTFQGTALMRETYQAAALETQLGDLFFVLPQEGTTPESLLQDPSFLSSLTLSAGDAVECRVEWSIPKFDVTGYLNLNDTLASMGLTDLLSPEKANLSGLTDLDAYLSSVRQTARVRVDEEGMEAAAVVIAASSEEAPQETEPCVMNLNRPFLFVLRCQGMPLLVGIINNV